MTRYKDQVIFQITIAMRQLLSGEWGEIPFNEKCNQAFNYNINYHKTSQDRNLIHGV